MLAMSHHCASSQHWRQGNLEQGKQNTCSNRQPDAVVPGGQSPNRTGEGREEKKGILKRRGEKITGEDGVEKKAPTASPPLLTKKRNQGNRKHVAGRVHLARIGGWKLRASNLSEITRNTGGKEEPRGTHKRAQK